MKVTKEMVDKAWVAHAKAVERGYLRSIDSRTGKRYEYTNIADIRRIDDRIRRLKVKYDKLRAEYLGRRYVPDYKGQDEDL